MHKANLGSQLSIFDTGSSARARPRPNGPPERVHPGALKRLARTTHPNDPPERPARTSSHGCPQTTRPNERPKRTDKGEPGKRAARTCTKPTSGHNLAFFIRPSPERVHTGILKRPARTSSHGRPQTPRPNGFAWAPERPKRTDKGEPGKRLARTSLYTANEPARTSSHGLRHTTKTKSQGRFGQTGGTIFARGPPPFTT